MSFDDIAGLDPTGLLSATSAAVGLVGTVLRTVPALKGSAGATRRPTAGGTPLAGGTANGVPSPAAAAADAEREQRAYETINYVLREFGSRLCAAGLVDERALGKALTAATQHIEVRLFSAGSNRLFESLASRLGDPLLVNCVFTSIYLIGALTAELISSLPNYKEAYVPVGPRLVQQLFHAAVGPDAFEENRAANLEACQTLASTAGLLRPTDIGYLTFPGLPSFSPCRYSSKSFGDVRRSRIPLETIVKHFTRFGFPQPAAHRLQEIGPIKEWRFLASDTNSKAFEVEKTDKHIGENFGRVLHWLICSADRMPAGLAVIAYYDQHIALLRWIGERMGYALLEASRDLDFSAPHTVLGKKERAIVDGWVVLVPSERSQGSRHAKMAEWTQTQMAAAARAPQIKVPQPPAPAPVQAPYQQAQPVPASTGGTVPSVTTTKTAIERLDELEMEYYALLLPQCQRFLENPPADARTRDIEYKRLTDAIERNVILKMDEIQTQGDELARTKRKDLIIKAQRMMDEMDTASSTAAPVPNFQTPPTQQAAATPVYEVPAATSGPFTQPKFAVAPSTETGLTLSPVSSTPSSIHTASLPPYSPATISPATTVGSSTAFPFPSKRTSVIRRKAPPPPKKYATAKALYDFEPEDLEEELAFRAGDELELIEKSAALEEEGWCKARVKGGTKVALAPLEYLEEVKGAAPAASGAGATVSRSATGHSSDAGMPHIREGTESTPQPPKPHASAAQEYYDATKPISPLSALQQPTAAGQAGQHSIPYRPSPVGHPQMHASQAQHPASKKPSGLQMAGLAVAGTGIAATSYMAFSGGSGGHAAYDPSAAGANAPPPADPQSQVQPPDATNNTQGDAYGYDATQAPTDPGTGIGASPLAGLAPPAQPPAPYAPADQFACDQTSPFAGLAGAPPADSAGFEPIGEPSVPVTTMTQQSEEAAQSNAEWTAWEAGNEADAAAYDMGGEF